MQRNKFLTFLAALVPGVGYMYLGLVKKGIQALAIFLLIEPLFSLVGLRNIGDIIQVIVWFYTFFDTFTIAGKIDKGEPVYDSDFFINKIHGNPNFSSYKNITSNKGLLVTVAWALIAIGVLAILNKLFYGNEAFNLIRSYVNMYFLPILLVFAGVYLLLKNK
jgi:TM2 domain-containing membrane protein YozV